MTSYFRCAIIGSVIGNQGTEVIVRLVRVDLLRGKIAEKGYSQRRMAQMLDITPKSFYNKMDKGVFKSNEIYKMIEILEIENPTAIFFAPEIAQSATSNDKE